MACFVGPRCCFLPTCRAECCSSDLRRPVLMPSCARGWLSSRRTVVVGPKRADMDGRERGKQQQHDERHKRGTKHRQSWTASRYADSSAGRLRAESGASRIIIPPRLLSPDAGLCALYIARTGLRRAILLSRGGRTLCEPYSSSTDSSRASLLSVYTSIISR